MSSLGYTMPEQKPSDLIGFFGQGRKNLNKNDTRNKKIEDKMTQRYVYEN